MKRAWIGILLGFAALLGVTLNQAEAGSDPSAGLRAMEQKQCIACHTIAGTDPHYRAAPNLDLANRKLKPDWLTSYLHNPEDLETSLNMPRIRLEPKEVQDLAAFVLGDPPPEQPVTIGDRARGRKLFEDLDCLACHYGGEFSPDLSNLGHKVRPDWLSAYMAKPQDYHTGVVMPSFRLTEAETRDMTAYLLGRAVLPSNISYKGGSREAGRALAEAKTCTSCHAMPGLRAPSKRALRSVSSDMQRDLKEVMAGRRELNEVLHPQLSRTMAYGWELDEDTAIARALLALGSPKWTKNQRTEDRVLAEGRRIVTKYNCRGCHIIEGRGEKFAPLLDIEALRVREGWLEHFLAKPRNLRPDHPGRMPSFPLKPAEIESLMEYFQVIAERNYPEPEEVTFKATPIQIAEGRNLFKNLNCGWCHQINGKDAPVLSTIPKGLDLSDSRRFAPDLGHTPGRLQVPWTDRWIQHPQDYLPDTQMPPYPLTSTEMAALRAYLFEGI